ncbi:MAG TPA: DUF4236 domain-containing protein [Rhizomicrobium sp.]|nr:DUF4236 domain-containing protein [Rhizomicrobium sp.]
MGFRFQKRISILPGVRINLSKSGASASLGPRGADVNIGRDGVTANAGIPGTGLSYREKVGKGGRTGWFGILAVVAGLGYWGFQHIDRIEKAVASRPVDTKSSTHLPTVSSTGSSTDVPSTSAASANVSGNMLRYVHRGNSILRSEPKTSGDILKREVKGATVTLVSEEADGWSRVTDGTISGYMRSSVLGTEPPR